MKSSLLILLLCQMLLHFGYATEIKSERVNLLAGYKPEEKTKILRYAELLKKGESRSQEENTELELLKVDPTVIDFAKSIHKMIFPFLYAEKKHNGKSKKPRDDSPPSDSVIIGGEDGATHAELLLHRCSGGNCLPTRDPRDIEIFCRGGQIPEGGGTTTAGGDTYPHVNDGPTVRSP